MGHKDKGYILSLNLVIVVIPFKITYSSLLCSKMILTQPGCDVDP